MYICICVCVWFTNGCSCESFEVLETENVSPWEDSNIQPLERSGPNICLPISLNTGSVGIDIFVVKLTFGMFTVRGQQHYYSTHEGYAYICVCVYIYIYIYLDNLGNWQLSSKIQLIVRSHFLIKHLLFLLRRNLKLEDSRCAHMTTSYHGKLGFPRTWIFVCAGSYVAL